MKGPDKSVPRFPPNPGELLLSLIVSDNQSHASPLVEANWGPKRKAGRAQGESVQQGSDEDEEEHLARSDEEREEKRPRRDN